MSLEYTIDIQLTELGFPDIFEPAETPVKEAPDPAASAPPACNPPPPAPSPPPPTVTNGDRPPVSKEGEKRPVKEEKVQVKEEKGQVKEEKGQVKEEKEGQKGLVKEEKVEDEKHGLDSGAATTETLVFNGTETRYRQEQKGCEDIEGGSEDDSGVSEEEEEEDEEDDGLQLGVESGGSGEQRCGACNMVLPSAFKLQDHMNLHTGERPYCCAECGKRFCQLVNYHAHLRSHARAKPPQDHSCRICQRGFDTDWKLKFHQETAHLEKEFYECDLCKRIFTSRVKCEEHIEWHKNAQGVHVCPKCDRHFVRSRSLSRHLQRACRDHSYRCSDCPLVFHRKNSLLQHSFTHLGLPAYTCIHCHLHFRLARHYNRHKCEPNSIHCVACLGVFLSQEDFRRHKEETGCWGHQGSKQGDEIRCMECGESFASAEELKKHAGAHQRVLTCYECGKGFRSALLLMSHMGGHAGQRPCLCQKCGLGFPHQQVYESHLKNCGNITLPTMAPKKPQKGPQQTTAKSPPTLTAEKVRIPRQAPVIPIRGVSSNVSSTLITPVGVLNSTLAPVGDSREGVWKLCLDKDPPPGVKLVVFVPANSHLASGLSCLSPSPPETPPASVCHPQHPGMVLPPAPRPNLGVEPYEATPKPLISLPRGAYKLSDVPLDLVKKTACDKQGPGDVLPLDLSLGPEREEQKADMWNKLLAWKQEIETVELPGGRTLMLWRNPHPVVKIVDMKSEREEGLKDGSGEVGSEGRERTPENEQDFSGGEVGSEGRGGVAEKESEGTHCGQRLPGDQEAQHSLQHKQGSDTSLSGLSSSDTKTQATPSPSPPSTPPPSKRRKLA